MLPLLIKAKLFYQSNGSVKTIGKIVEKLWHTLRITPFVIMERLSSKKALNKLKNLAKGKTVYVLIPSIDWHTPVFQRPHQIARELAGNGQSLVLFISDQYRYDRFAVCKEVESNLWLYSIRLTRRLDAALDSASHVVVFLSWPMHRILLKHFHFHQLVYEYIDEMSLLYFYNEEMEKAHQALMERADLTCCTAKKLYEMAGFYTDRAILCENACDYDRFSVTDHTPVEERLAKKKQKYLYTLGYYGSLGRWLDYGLIAYAAEKRKDWLFVLIGFAFDGTLDALDIKNHPNIWVIPAQPYEKLPSYLAGFDIALIPFLINEITESASPVKLFEYMASGTPILSALLPECERYSSVCCYRNADDFLVQAEYLLCSAGKEKRAALLKAEALRNTWTARVQLILYRLKETGEVK